MTRPRRDIASLADAQSIARKLINAHFVEPVDFRQFEEGYIFQPDNYDSALQLAINPGQDVLDYHDALVEICKGARFTGKHEKFTAAVYEAVRNAHQHGNRRDPSKSIDLHYRTRDLAFEVVVSDEGGILDSKFIPFIMLHREGLTKPYTFYDFSGNPRPEENSGIGTYVMHYSCDEVNYLRNRNNGLSVQLIVKANAPNTTP